jgi:hypothetical protein
VTKGLRRFTGTGETGEFAIQESGFHPQAGYGFKYTDEKYAFWFYVDFQQSEGSKGYRLFVKHATSERFAGGIPIVGRKDQTAIEENIRRYFERFDFVGQEISPSNPAPPVLFAWMLPNDDDDSTR